MSKRGPTAQRPWQPLVRGVSNFDKMREKYRAETGEDFPLEELLDYATREVWLNDRYVVSVDRRDDGSVECLSIRRQDRNWPRDWRHFQRIKNEIAGEEIEAVELYPAESRLMDAANQFWLWCLPVGERFGFGFDKREVVDADEAPMFNARQRAL